MAQAAPPAPTSPYPLTLELDSPNEIPRWQPLVSWLLILPHVVVLYVLNIWATICTIVAFFTILFTKRIPDWAFRGVVLNFRYMWRVASYGGYLRAGYPPFEFNGEPMDPGTDPARLSVIKPDEYARLLPLVKWLLVIPQQIVLLFLIVGSLFVHIIGFFTVLFTKRWPEACRNYQIGVFRWNARVLTYRGLIVDPYPPFRLSN